MDDKVLSVWRAYCNHVQKGKGHAINSENDTSTFSFILDALEEHREDLYLRHGFCRDTFKNLDQLISDIEQTCFWGIFAQYEKFRLHSESSIVQISKLDMKKQFQSPKSVKVSTRPQQARGGKTGTVDSPATENTPIGSLKRSPQADSEELGRGKRKKILKLKFDFLESPKKQCDTPNGVGGNQSSSKLSSERKHDKRPVKKADSGNKDVVVEKLKKDLKRQREEFCNFKKKRSLQSEEATSNKEENVESRLGTNDNGKKSLSVEEEKVISAQEINLKDASVEKENSDLILMDCVSSSDKNIEKGETQQDFGSSEETNIQPAQINSEFQKEEGEDISKIGELATGVETQSEMDGISKDNDLALKKTAVFLNPDEIDQVKLEEEREVDLEKSKSEPGPEFGSSELEPEVNTKTKEPAGIPGKERYDFDCDKLAPITCAFCRKSCDSSTELLAHWREKHRTEPDSKPGKVYTCASCDLVFWNVHQFILHYRVHTGARPHSCTMCDKTFRIYKGLKDHLTVHKKVKTFCCPVCLKMFASDLFLKRHLQRHNTERRRPYMCEHCGKSFEKKPALRDHFKSHTGEQPHKCTVCGVAFSMKSSLNTHMRLHTGDKNFVCDICGRRFNTNMAMVTHRRRHTGEKPFKCSQCDYRSASSSGLKDHSTVHRNEKPFECQVANCNRRFKRRAHLISHHKMHEGVKPYKCHLCGASFALTSHLRQHLRTDACRGGTEKVELPDIPDPEPAVSSEAHLGEAENFELKAEYITIGADNAMEEKHIVISDKPQSAAEMTKLPENSIVIQIVTEPGEEDNEIILSQEEMDAIVRLSQQM